MKNTEIGLNDIVLSALPSEERLAWSRPTEVYSRTKQQLFINEHWATGKKLDTIDEIRQQDAVIGLIRGWVYQDKAEAFNRSFKKQTVIKGDLNALMMLAAGRIDMAILNDLPTVNLAKEYGLGGFIAKDLDFPAEEYVMLVFRKGVSEADFKILSEALSRVVQSSAFKNMYRTYIP